MGMRGQRIPRAKQLLVLELRRKGLSIRQIVASTGLSRSSISRISRSAEGTLLNARPLGRCPTCGAMVRLPCLACSLERASSATRQAWRQQFRRLEESMDLVKEIVELKKAIQDALEDGRVTFLEMIKIASEAADVLRLLAPIILGALDARMAREESQT